MKTDFTLSYGTSLCHLFYEHPDTSLPLMHNLTEVFPGAKQAGAAAFSGECSSCLETLLVSELPCARALKRFNSGSVPPGVHNNLKEKELKGISWSFNLSI